MKVRINYDDPNRISWQAKNTGNVDWFATEDDQETCYMFAREGRRYFSLEMGRNPRNEKSSEGIFELIPHGSAYRLK